MKKLTFKHIGFTILCSLFFYSSIYKNFELLGYSFYYILPTLYLLINYRITCDFLKTILNSSLKKYIIVVIVLGILSLIIPLISGTRDFSYFSVRILQILKESIKIMFLLSCFIKYISPEGDYKLFMKYFVLSTCVYVGFTCLTLVFPVVRETIIDSLTLTPNDMRLLAKENYVTRFGWAGFSGYTFTLKATLSVIFTLYLLLIEKKKNFILNIIFLGISFLGNLFYGRIGLVVSSLFIMITLVRLFYTDKQLAKKIILIFITMFVIMLMIIAFSPKMQLWFAWAFQSIINLLTKGSISTTSTEALESMYKMPSIKTLLIGDGYYTWQGFYYMNVDIGILRPIYFGGILFQILRYSPICIICHVFIKNKFPEVKIFVFMIISLFLLFELKGESVFPIITILFSMAVLMEYNKGDNEDDISNITSL